MTRRVKHALDVAVQHEHKKTGPPRDARRKTRLWFVSHRRQLRGPERRPRQRSGFGEESPPKPLGKSPNRDQAART